MRHLYISSIKRKCPTKIKKLLFKILSCFRVVRYKIEANIYGKEMRFYCPGCNMRIRSFTSGSFAENPQRFDLQRYKHTKQDVLCPVCRCMPRHRILACWCDDHRSVFQSEDILYFAPEYSMMKWMKRNKVKCTTADLFSKNVDLQLDIQATGLPDESYDVVICNHVLEHVDDFRKALKEMYRILRPGGSFICSFPMDPKIELLDEDPSVQTEKERVERFGQNDHKRVFGMKADQFLVDAGFRVEKIDGKDYPEEILPVVGPADYDMNILFRCVKER